MSLDLEQFEADSIILEDGTMLTRFKVPAGGGKVIRLDQVKREQLAADVKAWLAENETRINLGARFFIEFPCKGCGQLTSKSFVTLEELEGHPWVKNQVCSPCLLATPSEMWK